MVRESIQFIGKVSSVLSLKPLKFADFYTGSVTGDQDCYSHGFGHLKIFVLLLSTLKIVLNNAIHL